MDHPSDSEGYPGTQDGTGHVGKHIGGRRNSSKGKQLIELGTDRTAQAYEQSQQEGSRGARKEAPNHQVPDWPEGQNVYAGLNECRCGEEKARKRDPQHILPVWRPVKFRPRQTDDKQYRGKPQEEQYSPKGSNHAEMRSPIVQRVETAVEL